RIECSSGAALFSWGENISISVEEIDPYSTRLSIHSGLKVQGTRQAVITGEGTNTRPVTVIVSALSNYLRTQKKPVRPAISEAAVPPPPPARSLSFFIYIKDEVKGPFSAAQIKALLRRFCYADNSLHSRRQPRMADRCRLRFIASWISFSVANWHQRLYAAIRWDSGKRRIMHLPIFSA